MNRRLFWKLCLIIATGAVVLFYFIDLAVSYTEEDMSMIRPTDREQLRHWRDTAETLFTQGNQQALDNWVATLQQQENTWVAVATADIQHVAGNNLSDHHLEGYNLGRNIDSKVHLYFKENPVMEVPFKNGNTSFLIQLPERMRPGTYWQQTRIAMQVILPLILLTLLSIVLYRHIMSPLRQLELATRKFSQGNLDVRVGDMLGSRNDELTELANTFDNMAVRIGELIVGQRQLIADLSHELRTPLARLDIAIDGLHSETGKQANLARIETESRRIRKLVDDTLTLAWLENERPQLKQESLDLVDLIDVLAEDARFEFPDRTLDCQLPDSALIENSNHRALGQALENVLRNAMRYTPAGKTVTIALQQQKQQPGHYHVAIRDQGPGVPPQHLQAIFKPFFRVETSRPASGDSTGLGLALAQRQLAAVGGTIIAGNLPQGGLEMQVRLPMRQVV